MRPRYATNHHKYRASNAFVMCCGWSRSTRRRPACCWSVSMSVSAAQLVQFISRPICCRTRTIPIASWSYRSICWQSCHFIHQIKPDSKGYQEVQRVLGSIHIQLRKGILYLCKELWDTLYLTRPTVLGFYLYGKCALGKHETISIQRIRLRLADAGPAAEEQRGPAPTAPAAKTAAPARRGGSIAAPAPWRLQQRQLARGLCGLLRLRPGKLIVGLVRRWVNSPTSEPSLENICP